MIGVERIPEPRPRVSAALEPINTYEEFFEEFTSLLRGGVIVESIDLGYATAFDLNLMAALRIQQRCDPGAAALCWIAAAAGVVRMEEQVARGVRAARTAETE